MTNTISKVIHNGVEYEFSGVNGGVRSVNSRTGDVTGLAEDNAVVKLTGNQTVAGTKTFSTSPVVPSKTSDATNTGTAIATEAQVYKKQDKLTTQTAYTTKGTATKVPTITTNTLGQVTTISETNIAFPVTSVNGQTGDITGLLTSETVLSGDTGITYSIKVSSSEPASGTPATTITFVTAS